MRVIRDFRQNLLCQQGSVVTIGNFDSVHRAHQAIIKRVVACAQERQLTSVVVTFEPCSKEFFYPDVKLARLSRLRDKLLDFQTLGVDLVILARFNQKFVSFSAEDFVKKILIEKLNLKYLMIGDDFRFGHGSRGDFIFLQHLSSKYGFIVEDTSTSFHETKQRISSTLVRQALAAGNLILAKELLGHYYHISGHVIYGNGRGHQIGFPTANISLQRKSSPLEGIFAAQVLVNGRVYFGVANIGRRPTIKGIDELLEVYLLNFEGNLYGQCLKVEFLHKIRDEICFRSLNELKQQISKDVEVAKHFFKT